MTSRLVMVCDVDLRLGDATRIHTIEVARAFAAEGVEVELVARGPDPGEQGVCYRAASGTDWQRVRRIRSINAASCAALWRQRKGRRRLYIRHSWTLVPVAVFARMLRYRIVLQLDGIPYGRGFEGDVAPLADYTKRFTLVIMGMLTHVTVAITPRIKELLAEQYRFAADSVVVLPNGADVDVITPVPRSEAIHRVGLPASARYMVFCGGLHPWVDFDLLMDAFASVHQVESDVRLLLVGDGSERKRIEARARDIGIDDALIITGAVFDRALIRDYLGTASFTLVAYHSIVNRSGALPSKVPEYMAAGRALIVKDVPVLSDAVREAEAGLVVSGDRESVANAMRELLRDPAYADRLGASGREAAVTEYSWRSIVRRILTLFAPGAGERGGTGKAAETPAADQDAVSLS